MFPDIEKHELIKARLRIAGTSLKKIAVELGVSASSMSNVSQGYRRSRRIEDAIALALGTTPDVLWPSKYSRSKGTTPERLKQNQLERVRSLPATSVERKGEEEAN